MNDKRGKTFLVWLNLPRLLLHIICYLCSKNRGVIMQDLLARPLHCQLSAMQKGLLSMEIQPDIRDDLSRMLAEQEI